MAASDQECASTTYTCPNCGGHQVTDCLECDGFLHADPKHDICFDRHIFNRKNEDPSDHENHYHHLLRDLIGMCVWFVAAGVATACGVGGGGIYVPLGILLLGFAPKPSSGLSQASIFGASLGGLLLNMPNQHPNTEIDDGTAVDNTTQTTPRRTYTRPLIDYDMALFLAPMEMAGAVLGVLIQKLLPNWLYLGLAAIILGLTARKTYTKYVSTHEAEVENRRNMESEIVAVDDSNPHEHDEQAPLRSPSDSKLDPSSVLKEGDQKKVFATSRTVSMNAHERSGGLDSDAEEVDVVQSRDIEQEVSNESSSILVEYSDAQIEERQCLLQQDERQYPAEKLMALIILWIGLVILTFLKGGKGVDSLIGITCQSSWYAVLIAVQFIWTLGIASFFAIHLVRKQQKKDACGYPLLESDVVWSPSKCRFYAFFTFCAGIVAGLIGIGGGMVLGPLMLVMGIHPRVSSATTATMIVLTSSSVAVLFVTTGLVPWQYAICFFSICFSGALVGKRYIDGYVQRTGKASFLIFLLATIIALATIGCIVIVFTRLAEADWCFEGFKSFCDVKEGDRDDASCVGNRLLQQGDLLQQWEHAASRSTTF